MKWQWEVCLHYGRTTWSPLMAQWTIIDCEFNWVPSDLNHWKFLRRSEVPCKAQRSCLSSAGSPKNLPIRAGRVFFSDCISEFWCHQPCPRLCERPPPFPGKGLFFFKTASLVDAKIKLVPSLVIPQRTPNTLQNDLNANTNWSRFATQKQGKAKLQLVVCVEFFGNPLDVERGTSETKIKQRSAVGSFIRRMVIFKW